jgi:hypothetical protein
VYQGHLAPGFLLPFLSFLCEEKEEEETVEAEETHGQDGRDTHGQDAHATENKL